MIDPGKMDRRINVQKKIRTRLPSGQIIEGYQPDVQCWAMVHSARGNEVYQADKKSAWRRRSFVTRYHPQITELHTIVYEAVRWDIESIEEIGRRTGLSITATWTDGQYNYPDDVIPEPEEEE